MSKTDIIIKYLSEDLQSKERLQFEKLLENDKGFYEEYSAVRKIWQLTKTQLSIADLPESNSREELIAAVLAADDVKQYRSDTLSKKEQAFKDNFEKLMNPESQNDLPQNKRSGRRKFRLSILITAVAAVFLLFLTPGKDLNTLVSVYFNPVNEPDLEEFVLTLRSDNLSGIYHFNEGDFVTAKKTFEENKIGISQPEKLYYAIACFKTGEQDKAISLLEELSLAKNVALSYRSKWYLSLMYLEKGDIEKAKILLLELKDVKGIYYKKTRKLLRKTK